MRKLYSIQTIGKYLQLGWVVGGGDTGDVRTEDFKYYKSWEDFADAENIEEGAICTGNDQISYNGDLWFLFHVQFPNG